MEYARITSTIGARQSGHFPPPRTNSFAHFEQVHMCPHLHPETKKKGKGDTQRRVYYKTIVIQNECVTVISTIPVQERIDVAITTNTTSPFSHMTPFRPIL